ncbi:MAG: hypothetical protein R3A46_09575, partial [Thermomicrobiales bacterium]
MKKTPRDMSDEQIDELLTKVGDHLDVPPMPNAAATARARIEQRRQPSRTTGKPVDVIPRPGAVTSPLPDPPAAAEQLGRNETSRRRELALLAAVLAAATIIGLVLTLVFRGWGSDGGDASDPKLAGGPLAAEPYAIPGYEFVTAAGQPQVPNEPVDIAIGPDGTQYVLDIGLRRVVAFTPDGEIRTGWGDEGFSAPLPEGTADAIGVGPDSQIYVALPREVLVFDATGEQEGSWPFPEHANNDTRSGRSQGLVVDSDGNVYVAGRGVIWRFETGTGTATTIEIGSETDIQLDIDDRGQLLAASWPGGIYRVGTDGEMEHVGGTNRQADINGFAVAPDGRFVIFRSSTGTNEASTFTILDSEGTEARSWPVERHGMFAGPLGPYWIGIDVTQDGTIVLPDYMGHRITYYNTDGTLDSEIRDEQPGAFGRLWRIAVDEDGNVLGYDPSLDPKVVRFAPDGEVLEAMRFEAPLLGAMASLFDGNGFAATEDGGFIVAHGMNSVSVHSPEGDLLQNWDPGSFESDAGITFPSAVATDDDGFVYIVDQGFAGSFAENLRKFTIDGEFVAEIGSIGYPARADIAYRDGAIWAVDDGSIVRYPIDGGEPETIASPDTDEGDGSLPGLAVSLAIDPQGNILTYMFRLDGGQGRFPSMLAKLDTQGNVIWTADLADDSGNRYIDLAIADDGTLYLSDSELRQILVYRPTGEGAAESEPTPMDNPSGDGVDLLLP